MLFRDRAMDEPQKLRELAAWYREFAEKTGNPAIWEARLRMAEDLEREAAELEKGQVSAAALAT
jgi:hypothetical protein